jgi:hypothetical protein
MKRAAVFAIIAIVALVLVYPAAAPSASPPGPRNIPIIQIITPESGDGSLANSGNDGDADDLAGIKDRKNKPTGTSFQSDFAIKARFAARVWQMYFFVLGLYR